MNPDTRLFRQIMWFDRQDCFDLEALYEILQPKRKVSVKPQYKSGLFYSEKCGRNIQYESGRELEFIKLLEASKKVAFYFEQPIRIPYRRGRKRLYYTPDFGVHLNTGEFVIVEVKELGEMLDDKVQVKMQGLMEYCSKMGFGLLLTDGVHTFDDLKKIKLNRKLEGEILAAIEGRVLLQREYNDIRKRCGATHKELLRVIMKHDLYYNSRVFRLRRGGYNTVFRQVFVNGQNYSTIIFL